MPKENIVVLVVIFASTLFAIVTGVIISFISLYQKKKFTHQRDIQRIEETFIKEMLSSQIEMQEQTLQQIATEIHDNFTTSLSVVNLELAGVLHTLNEPAKATITDAKGMLKQIMSDMKDLSISLNSDHITNTGFSNALERYAQRIGKHSSYNVLITKNGAPVRIQDKKEVILFRMCQEILNNIIKHAEATQIEITFDYQTQHFTVQITDNGNGFNADAAKALAEEKESTGLINLYKRASVIGAILTITSAPGKGTTAKITVQL